MFAAEQVQTQVIFLRKSINSRREELGLSAHGFRCRARSPDRSLGFDPRLPAALPDHGGALGLRPTTRRVRGREDGNRGKKVACRPMERPEVRWKFQAMLSRCCPFTGTDVRFTVSWWEGRNPKEGLKEGPRQRFGVSRNWEESPFWQVFQGIPLTFKGP